jgi:hypothetical protein
MYTLCKYVLIQSFLLSCVIHLIKLIKTLLFIVGWQFLRNYKFDSQDIYEATDFKYCHDHLCITCAWCHWIYVVDLQWEEFEKCQNAWDKSIVFCHLMFKGRERCLSSFPITSPYLASPESSYCWLKPSYASCLYSNLVIIVDH